MISLDPSLWCFVLFVVFFVIGYESEKRSGGFFMIFAGLLLISLGILLAGAMLYANGLTVPFGIFLLILGGKKGFYGTEAEEKKEKVKAGT